MRVPGFDPEVLSTLFRFAYKVTKASGRHLRFFSPMGREEYLAALLILTEAKQFASCTRTIVALLLSARARIRTWDLYNVNVAL